MEDSYEDIFNSLSLSLSLSLVFLSVVPGFARAEVTEDLLLDPVLADRAVDTGFGVCQKFADEYVRLGCCGQEPRPFPVLCEYIQRNYLQCWNASYPGKFAPLLCDA